MSRKIIPLKDRQDWTVEKVCKNCANWYFNNLYQNIYIDSKCSNDNGNTPACDNFRPPLKPFYQKLERKKIEEMIARLKKLV